MATTKKPAASAKRKTTTARKITPRRKPTKPEVTVQLTPEAQDALNADEPTTNSYTPPRVANDYTPEQKQAKLEAYHTLKQAGLEIPADLAAEVEGWIGDEIQRQQEQEVKNQESAVRGEENRIAKLNVEGPWYVRNCYPAPFNFRLDRQTEKRRIELKARGVPGDLHPLKDDDLNDPILRSNVSIGLLEVIPAGEAQLVIENQMTNASQRVHTPLAVLQKEYDTNARNHMEVNPFQGVRVETEYNRQGVLVAAVDPRIAQGQLHDRQVGTTGGLQRTQPGQPTPQFVQPAPTVYSGFVPTGGNPAIISQGVPGGVQNRIQADIANRGRTREALLHPGPAELTVTVAPTERN
jgi:hypothetical protein